MKKLMILMVVVTLALTVLGTAGYVYAQSANPQGRGPGSGNGMMGGRGGHAGMMAQTGAVGTQDGLIHDEMISVFGEKLGISVEDLNTRLAAGETMAQIAVSKGISAEQFPAWMADVRTKALDAAVKNGTLTQAQADWMKQRGAGTNNQTGRGMRGGMNGSAGMDCPFDGDETNQ